MWMWDVDGVKKKIIFCMGFSRTLCNIIRLRLGENCLCLGIGVADLLRHF